MPDRISTQEILESGIQLPHNAFVRLADSELITDATVREPQTTMYGPREPFGRKDLFFGRLGSALVFSIEADNGPELA